MDLMKETSGGIRILTARHISSDKALPERSEATTNTTLLCEKLSYEPDVQIYLADLGSYAFVIFPLAAVCVFVLATLFCVTLKNVRKRSKQGCGNIALVISVYPIVGLCSFMVVLLPRVRILAEAVAQEAVMVAMYYFYCFIIAECGGKEQMVRRSNGAALQTRVLPCCCWPCCVLPRPQLQKKHLTWIGYLILQMPIIQAIIYLIVLILWAEDTKLYASSFSYLQPLIAASIMSGVWGVIMAVKASGDAGVPLRPHFFAVQLTLVIVKLQNGFTKALPNIVTLPCPMNLHPVVLANLIQSSITLIEMVLLSLFASRLYSRDTKRVERVQHVVIAVLEDSISSEKKHDNLV